jgi:hypothetical protein
LGLQADCGRRSAPARGPAPQEGFALASANAACKAVHRLVRRRAARRCKPSPDTNSPVDCLCLARDRATGPTGPARGLTLHNLDGPCDAAPRAAGFGCVRGFAGSMAEGWRPRITHRLRPRETIFGGAVKAQQSFATFRDRHARVEGRVRGAMGKEIGRLKILSSAQPVPKPRGTTASGHSRTGSRWWTSATRARTTATQKPIAPASRAEQAEQRRRRT